MDVVLTITVILVIGLPEFGVPDKGLNGADDYTSIKSSVLSKYNRNG